MGVKIDKIYVWTKQVRPVVAIIDFILAWGWGAWGRSNFRSWGWWWAGWLIHCELHELLSWSYCVVIWAWGTWSNTQYLAACWSGGDSCFGDIVAYWGWGGWGQYACSTGSAWASWWSWWGSSACNTTRAVGCDWQWNMGWGWCQCRWWWGWWYCCAWNNATSSWNYGWSWWCWYYSEISWVGVRYSSGGSGWYLCTTAAVCWGWAWWACRVNWWNATTYWSWWGWAWCTNSSSVCCKWWDWCQWVFIVRYPTACWYHITWWTKYECNWYCIHCFTSDWTLCFTY